MVIQTSTYFYSFKLREYLNAAVEDPPEKWRLQFTGTLSASLTWLTGVDEGRFISEGDAVVIS